MDIDAQIQSYLSFIEMFSIFRRKPSATPATFNKRVSAFWKWFEEVAPRFYQTIEAKKCSDLGTETSAKIDELFPGFAWVFGPGAGSIGHSFTLTGEGVIHRQLLALNWLSQAPKIEGWTFYAARQPGPIKGHVIEMDDIRFDPREIWVTPEPDLENRCFDLKIWHPSWDHIEQTQKWTIVFLFLDEALGEYGTGWWIGEINFSKDKLAESFPLEELASFVDEIAAKHEWKKYPPGESYTLFELKPGNMVYPRSDILLQTTSVSKLFHEYVEAEGQMEDQLAELGADYLYIAIAKEFFPRGDEVTKRREIEDALEAALKPSNAGRQIGSAFGTEFGYIDLLIYDGPRSLAIIKKVLQQLEVPSGTMIEFFAREKRSQRIAL